MHNIILLGIIAGVSSAVPLPQGDALGLAPVPQKNGDGSGGLLGNLGGAIGGLLGSSQQAGGSSGGLLGGLLGGGGSPQQGGAGGLLGGLTNTLGQALQPINTGQNAVSGNPPAQLSQTAAPQTAPLPQIPTQPAPQPQSSLNAYVCIPVAQLAQAMATQPQTALQPATPAQAIPNNVIPSSPQQQSTGAGVSAGPVGSVPKSAQEAAPQGQKEPSQINPALKSPPKQNGPANQSSIPLGGFAPFQASNTKPGSAQNPAQSEKPSAVENLQQPKNSTSSVGAKVPTKPREPVKPKGLGE